MLNTYKVKWSTAVESSIPQCPFKEFGLLNGLQSVFFFVFIENGKFL